VVLAVLCCAVRRSWASVLDSVQAFGRLQCACNSTQGGGAGGVCSTWACSGRALAYIAPNLKWLAFGLLVGGPSVVPLWLMCVSCGVDPFRRRLRGEKDTAWIIFLLGYLISLGIIVGVFFAAAYTGGVAVLVISFGVSATIWTTIWAVITWCNVQRQRRHAEWQAGYDKRRRLSAEARELHQQVQRVRQGREDDTLRLKLLEGGDFGRN
jgi:hypothetical protein